MFNTTRGASSEGIKKSSHQSFIAALKFVFLWWYWLSVWVNQGPHLQMSEKLRAMSEVMKIMPKE